MSTRQRLLEAAAEQFARAGCHGTTVRDIARAAHVAPARVGYFFASKDDLFEAALSDAHAILGGLACRARSDGSALDSVVRYFETVLGDARARRAFHVSAWGLATPIGAAPWPHPGLIEPLSGLIEAGQRDGSISRRHDAELLTLSVLAVVIQAASPLLEQMGGSPDPREIGDYVRRALRVDRRGDSNAVIAPAPGFGTRRIV